MTYDGSAGADQKMHFYVNGVNAPAAHAGSFDVGGTPQDTGGVGTRIGTLDQTGTQLRFNGLIDEVEVFNRVLTGNEANEIFAAGSNGKCKANPTIAVNGTANLTVTITYPTVNLHPPSG